MNKETKKTLYAILGIFLLGILVAIAIFLYKTLKKAHDIGVEAIKATAEDTAISSKTGLTKDRIGEIRVLANNIANEIGTGSQSSFWQSWVDSDEDKIINWCNSVKSDEEAKALKNIYENSIVSGSNFYNDLDSVMTNSSLQKVTYINQFM